MAKENNKHVERLGDRSTSDVIVRLRTKDGRDDWFYCHSEVIIKHGKYFSERLSDDWPTCQLLDSRNCVEVYCTELDYDYHVKILRLFYISDELVTDSYHNVHSTLALMKVAKALGCNGIISNCVKYLEAVPWDENEEEEILTTIPSLGLEACPVLARLQPVDPKMVREVFLSAVNAATSFGKMSLHLPTCPTDLRSSAQEQVEYMLNEDDDAPLLAADDNIKYEVEKRLAEIFDIFKSEIGYCLSTDSNMSHAPEKHAKESASSLLWLCHISPKMGLSKTFVDKWLEASDGILCILQDVKLRSSLWETKLKVIEITAKVFEAVGYGHVVLCAPSRAHLVKTWLPFIRETKPLIDLQYFHEKLPQKMDNDLCQSIESALISLVLTLPSADQTWILADWLKMEQTRYPDLSEAFDVWCYRAKVVKQKLSLGLHGVSTSKISSTGEN